ncbi:MAG: hypothetical protein ACI4QG_03745 [Candidatus Cryptobacteroides sp.]
MSFFIRFRSSREWQRELWKNGKAENDREGWTGMTGRIAPQVRTGSGPYPDAGLY